MLRVHVFSCTLKEGIGQKSGRPYRFYVVNCQMTLPDGRMAGGDIITDTELKPGAYNCVVSVDNVNGSLTPKFTAFTPLSKAA